MLQLQCSVLSCTHPAPVRLIHLPQLVKTQPAAGQYAEWGEFLHAPGKRFYDFDRIRQASTCALRYRPAVWLCFAVQAMPPGNNISCGFGCLC